MQIQSKANQVIGKLRAHNWYEDSQKEGVNWLGCVLVLGVSARYNIFVGTSGLSYQ